jgi:hypothetical protein
MEEKNWGPAQLCHCLASSFYAKALRDDLPSGKTLPGGRRYANSGGAEPEPGQSAPGYIGVGGGGGGVDGGSWTGEICQSGTPPATRPTYQPSARILMGLGLLRQNGMSQRLFLEKSSVFVPVTCLLRSLHRLVLVAGAPTRLLSRAASLVESN